MENGNDSGLFYPTILGLFLPTANGPFFPTYKWSFSPDPNKIEDQKKRRLIEKLGLDVNEYSYLFDDTSEAPTEEKEDNETKSNNYYMEEEIFKAKGIPEESLRFADEVTRRLVLQRAGLQYEDFKGYFVEFDLAQKWMNRTDNDLTMLQEILKTLEENPDMLKRGITEWTDGKIKVIARKK